MENGTAGRCAFTFSIFHFPFAITLLALLVGGCFTQPAKVIRAVADPPRAFHIHLPGIGGYRSIDRGMLRGLQEGGLDAEMRPYDWTQRDPGLSALLATQRHKVEMARVARMIEDLVHEHPDAKLTISCHSGGAGIVIWALELLPDDVMIQDLLLLSPALSPTYDLSKALRHVRGKAYVIYSPYDAAVLGIGTKMFGTIDGIKTDASGRVGFAKPDGADEGEYEKLVQVPYDSRWVRLGNIGDHIGSMARPFAKQVLAALLLRGELPPAPQAALLTVPATLPTGAPDVPPALPALPALPTTTPAIPAPAP